MRGLGLGLIVVATLVAACACKQKSPGTGGTGPGGDGGGTGSGSGFGSGTGDPAACDGAAGRIEGLYQAAAGVERAEPTTEVKDNVAMVLAECRTAPDRVLACLAKVNSVLQLETLCLAPLDDEGSEGLTFQGK